MKKVPEQLVLDVEGSLSSVLAPVTDSRQQSDCRWNSDHQPAQGYKRDIQNLRSLGVFMSGGRPLIITQEATHFLMPPCVPLLGSLLFCK